MSSPKSLMTLNGMAKRPTMPTQRHSQDSPVSMTPHHEEIIKYISEQWSRVSHEFDRLTHQNGSENRGGVAYYQGSRDGSPFLKDFKAVDLERMVQRSHQRPSDPHLGP